MKKVLPIVLFFCFALSHAQKIEAILELKKQQDSLVIVRTTYFDTEGNTVKEVQLYDNRKAIKTIDYRDKKPIRETTKDCFVKRDTCVLRSYATIAYSAKTKTETRTYFDPNDRIRKITKRVFGKRLEISTTYSYELGKERRIIDEIVSTSTDSIFYDKKGRGIKAIHRMQSDKGAVENPWTETWSYSKKGYTYTKTGTSSTTESCEFHKLQALADKQKLNYQFCNDPDFQYEIVYF